ncbi:MAG: thioredoxin [Epulopiscium sp.]|nr:thioredoxin [Candidatus Epulonipiscium sp.]
MVAKSEYKYGRNKERIRMAVLKVTKHNFEEEVIQGKETVLLDFWAPWCGPCRMMSPVVESIAQETSKVKVCKVNVDEEPELAQAFQVMSIPSLVVMKEGKVINTAVGARPKEEVLKMLGK